LIFFFIQLDHMAELGSAGDSIHRGMGGGGGGGSRGGYQPLDIEAALRAVQNAGIQPNAIF
jgi:hypothetical protein